MTEAVYLDSSAIVKLAVVEVESDVLRRQVQDAVLVSSALARTEVCRALLPHGMTAVERGLLVLRGLELIRLSDRLLSAAGVLLPAKLRSLDAIHLGTAAALGADLAYLCTYDQRMASAAAAAGLTVAAPR